jgi:ribosome modulation factor
MAPRGAAAVRVNDHAWMRGFAAGVGAHTFCPYLAGTDDALAWLEGWIEGDATRLDTLSLGHVVICQPPLRDRADETPAP